MPSFFLCHISYAAVNDFPPGEVPSWRRTGVLRYQNSDRADWIPRPRREGAFPFSSIPYPPQIKLWHPTAWAAPGQRKPPSVVRMHSCLVFALYFRSQHDKPVGWVHHNNHLAFQAWSGNRNGGGDPSLQADGHSQAVHLDRHSIPPPPQEFDGTENL